MATYILKWNPAISSYKMMDFLCEMDMAMAGGEPNMNWSVWEYEEIKKGDFVYMLKVGYGATGIVAKGRVTARAYQGEDWSGRGRETYYVDFIPLCMVCADAAPILTSQQLAASIPDFDWRGGHSGQRLTPEQEAAMESLWDAYVLESFGKKPVSNPPAVYFRSRRRNKKAESINGELTNLGIALFNAVERRRRHPQGYDHMLHSKQLAEVICWLVKDAADTLAFAWSNLDCANHTSWRESKHLIYLRNAVNAFRSLQQQGLTKIDMETLERRLSEREEFAEYMSGVEQKAESGVLAENLRELTEGFDEFTGKCGSFHDSEVLAFQVSQEDDFVELKISMDKLVTIRLEGYVEYEVSGDDYCDIYWGYFYRYGDRVCLHLSPFGEISADRLRIVSVDPLPEEDD